MLTLKITNVLKETDNFFENYYEKLNFEYYYNIDNMFQVTCYENNNIIGILIFQIRENGILICYSLVIPEKRGLKINSLMINKLETFAKNKNIDLLMCNVRESNISSLNSFTKNNNFKINNNYHLKYKDGENKLSLFKKLNNHE
jgi:ribosomal protein S18 acetylase RimI-like enzyme